MKLVVIESPLRGDVERNKRYARRAMVDSLHRGEAPYASHLLLDQPGILNDLLEVERSLGMKVGLAWGAKADLVAVYADLGISEGMQAGIDAAKARGQKIDVRYLDK